MLSNLPLAAILRQQSTQSGASPNKGNSNASGKSGDSGGSSNKSGNPQNAPTPSTVLSNPTNSSKSPTRTVSVGSSSLPALQALIRTLSQQNTPLPDSGPRSTEQVRAKNLQQSGNTLGLGSAFLDRVRLADSQMNAAASQFGQSNPSIDDGSGVAAYRQAHESKKIIALQRRYLTSYQGLIAAGYDPKAAAIATARDEFMRPGNERPYDLILSEVNSIASPIPTPLPTGLPLPTSSPIGPTPQPTSEPAPQPVSNEPSSYKSGPSSMGPNPNPNPRQAQMDTAMQDWASREDTASQRKASPSGGIPALSADEASKWASLLNRPSEPKPKKPTPKSKPTA